MHLRLDSITRKMIVWWIPVNTVLTQKSIVEWTKAIHFS